MTEEILVFRGIDVTYSSAMRAIECVSKDDCFQIRDVDPRHVIGDGVAIIFFDHDIFEVYGTELWSDGELWIIRGWRPR